MIEMIMGFLLFNDYDWIYDYFPYRDPVKLQMCSLKTNFGLKPGFEWLQQQFAGRSNITFSSMMDYILFAYELFSSRMGCILFVSISFVMCNVYDFTNINLFSIP